MLQNYLQLKGIQVTLFDKNEKAGGLLRTEIDDEKLPKEVLDKEIEDFEIRLIAIPESCLSTSADEVMMHINVMDAKPNYDARINIELSDVFESDKSELNTKLFSEFALIEI